MSNNQDDLETSVKPVTSRNSLESSSVASFDSSQVQSYNGSENNKSVSRSLSTTLSRVQTAMSQVHMVQSIRQTVTNAREDDEIAEENAREARQTNLGRILTHPDISDAMRVATHKDDLAAELASIRPEDDRAVRKLTTKTELTQEMTHEEEEEEKKKYPKPDCGYAWVICCTELLMIATTWGATTSFGVYISYWLNNNTFAGADPMNYALSSSLTVFLAQALAPVAMVSFNMIGLKPTVAIGTVFHFAGYFLCSYSTKLWQLYCTQGLLLGFGFSMIFNPCVVILSSWFLKYRAISSGIVVCGAGVGGVAFALGSQDLISSKNDFRWGMRMIAIVTVILNCLILVLIRERAPANRVRSWKALKNQSHIILNYKVLKHWYVMAIILWFAMGIIAYMVLTFSLASFSTFIGLTEVQGSHITGIFNGCQAIGRAFIGVIGDKYGRINTALILNVVVIILIFAYFINCKTVGSLIGFAVLSGLVTGWCQLLNQAIMPDAVPMSDYPSVWSYENIIVGCFCLFAEVVALKLRDLSSSMPFLKAQLFSGFMVVGSLLALTPVREWKVREMLKSRLEDAEDLKKSEKTEDLNLVNARIERYQRMLEGGFRPYLKRLFYPVKA